MVGMGVREEQSVELRQLLQRDSRRGHARQDASELRIEVRIGENRRASDLEEERRVADVSDLHWLEWRMAYCESRARCAGPKRPASRYRDSPFAIRHSLSSGSSLD